MRAKVMYRWECPRCRKHGRWLLDPYIAKHYGMTHDERHGGIHWHYTVRLVDNTGSRHADHGVVA